VVVRPRYGGSRLGPNRLTEDLGDVHVDVRGQNGMLGGRLPGRQRLVVLQVPPSVVHAVDVPDGAVLSVEFVTRPWRHQEAPPGGATWR
jgi:hypothetical protein